MSSGDQPRNWKNPTSVARIPVIASVFHNQSFLLNSLAEMKALTDRMMYISAVNSPASKAAGTRPHQLWCGMIEMVAEMMETTATAVMHARIARVGRDVRIGRSELVSR